MTIEASAGEDHAPQPPRHRPSMRRAPGLPIGEMDANIFNCPACARPLSIEVRRCPGCGVRLISGTRLTKAIGFGTIGLSLGLLAGVAGMTVTNILARPVDPVSAGPSAIPSVAVTAPPLATADPSVIDGIPTAAVSALRQSSIVNQRVVADADRLDAMLAIKWPDAKDIAPILRSLAATAASGDRVAPAIGRWDQGEPLAQALVTFYAAIGGAADDGLAASLSNDRAYIDAGRRMLSIVAGLDDLDMAARDLAAAADVELPLLRPDATAAPSP